MTYHAGIGPALARETGVVERGPHVTCDACGAIASGTTARGDCAAWLREGKAPPGWLSTRRADGGTVDYCKACRRGRK